MTIATQQDVIDHLGNNGAVALAQMTDPAGAAINSGLVAVYLQRSDEEIYPYLGAVMTVPLTSPYPPLLVKIACVIAVYWMWSGDERPDRIKDDYKWAAGLLKDVSTGKLSLGLSGDGTGEAQTSGGEVNFVSSDAVFSRETLEAY